MGQLFTRQAGAREQRDELLSAYLDGQLSAGERARLEARLATDPELQAELAALRRTVALVRDLPMVPIPRNFILPQTVVVRPRPMRRARPRRAWAAPFLTAATAVVSLLFVVVLAGDLLLSSTGGLAFAPASEPLMEAEAPQMALEPSPISQEVEGEVEVEKVMPATSAPTMAMEAPPEAASETTPEAEGYGAVTLESREFPAPAMDAGPSEEIAAPAPSPGPTVVDEVAAAPAAPATLEGAGAAAPAIGGGESVEEAATPVPSPGPAAAVETAAVPTAPATATAMPEKGLDIAAPPPSEVSQAPPPGAEGEEPEIAEGERGVPESEVAGLGPALPWRALEVVLGLTALGLMLVTVWAWRVRRP
jgi:hypothetical protein